MWRSDARWRRLTPLGCVAFTKVKWFTCALGNTSSTPSWNAEQPEKKREKPVEHKKVFTNVLSHACASSRECWGRTSAGWKELLTDEYFPADCLNSMRLPQWRDTWGRASIRRAEWVHFYQCTGLIDIHFRCCCCKLKVEEPKQPFHVCEFFFSFIFKMSLDSNSTQLEITNTSLNLWFPLSNFRQKL